MEEEFVALLLQLDEDMLPTLFQHLNSVELDRSRASSLVLKDSIRFAFLVNGSRLKDTKRLLHKKHGQEY